MRTPAEAIATLRKMKEPRLWNHVFWADDFSIADQGTVFSERIVGPKQVTDVYLAALAFRKAGRLVTFDTLVAWNAVKHGSRQLIEIPAL
jgi:predicted nucleic acid-binding protein